MNAADQATLPGLCLAGRLAIGGRRGKGDVHDPSFAGVAARIRLAAMGPWLAAAEGVAMARTKLPGGAIAMAVGGVLAALCYLWFLSTDFASISGPGDSVVGQAFETLTALACLWILLLVLLAFDRGLGGRSWSRRAGFVLAPIAAVATVFATDYPSDWLCQATVVGLPLLLGIYLLVGRLPRRRSAIAQAAVLLPIAALSAYAIVRFSS
jgi:hypothetical protein